MLVSLNCVSVMFSAESGIATVALAISSGLLAREDIGLGDGLHSVYAKHA